VDNIAFAPHAFVVSIVKTDSVHFNQVGGRKMRGFFKDGKIDKIFVAGNAETVYYNRDSLDHPTSIVRTKSSRIGVKFLKGEVAVSIFTVKPELIDIPLPVAKEDDKILKGFLWKPKERPVSKESIIPSVYTAKPEGKKPPVKKKVSEKPTNKTKLPAPINLKSKTDTTKVKVDTLKQPVIKPDIVKSN
jgi:hypothetical protein